MRAFTSIVERKEDNYSLLGAYIMGFESIMDFTKKIPSLVSLIASIVFNNSTGVDNQN